VLSEEIPARAEPPPGAQQGGWSDAHWRRLDWRFVIPAPPEGGYDHLVLLGGPSALAEAALACGLARRVSRAIPASTPADAVVILRGADAALADARAALAPEGVLFWEIDRRRRDAPSTPRAIRRRLEEVGLQAHGLYWPRPAFASPAMYLPVGRPGVFRWYVDTLMDSGSPGRNVLRLLLRAVLGRRGRGGGSFLPRFAVTAASSSATDSGTPAAVLLRGRDASRQVVLFLFPEGAAQPSGVLKLWRSAARNGKTERVQETLREIRERLPEHLARTLPEPLGTLRWGQSVAGLESYVGGRPLSLRLRSWGLSRKRKLADVAAVLRWIADFQGKAQVRRERWDAAALRQWLHEPLSRYASTLGASPAEERLFDSLRTLGRELVGRPLPVVWSHPDLTPANVHLDGERVGVVDWSGTEGRLPLCDLLTFGVIAMSILRGRPGSDGQREAFAELLAAPEPGDRVLDTMRGGIRGYLVALEIDPRFFPILAVLHWVGRSLDSQERAEACARGEAGANPHPGESYVEHVRIAASARQALFSPSPWWAHSPAEGGR
jgi:hypothetical protein